MSADQSNRTHWKGVSWTRVSKGQQVWLEGAKDGEFYAYGPHTVINRRHYKLKSGTPKSKDAVFKHMREDLLVPVELDTPIKEAGGE